MWQVIVRIPINFFGWSPDGIPIYGFGMMLFLAFLLCTYIAGRRAQRAGIPPELIQDLAIWLFVGGLIGARVTYLLQQPDSQIHSVGAFFRELPQIWNGGHHPLWSRARRAAQLCPGLLG